jgi:hypothetical protein
MANDDGHPVTAELAIATSPYMRKNIRRFGKYGLDMEEMPAPTDRYGPAKITQFRPLANRFHQFLSCHQRHHGRHPEETGILKKTAKHIRQQVLVLGDLPKGKEGAITKPRLSRGARHVPPAAAGS